MKPALGDEPQAGEHRRVLRLAVPMIISNLSVPLLGIVDTIVVGHLPEPHYLGGVAVGATIFSFVFWSFGFLRMGTTGFVAQALGSGVAGRVQTRFVQAALLALTLALVLLLSQAAIRLLAFTVLDASMAVEEQARLYFDVRIWAAPATLLSYVVVGWFLGMQNARASLAIVLTANLVNVVLDVLFVTIMGWGVTGVALASVFGEYLALLVGGVLVLRSGYLQGHRWRWTEILRRADLSAMLKVNTDIWLRTLCLIFAFAFFTRQGAALGEAVLAANAVLMNFQHFMAYGLDGFAHAAEAMVGRAHGAGKRSDYRRVVAITGVWSVAVALLCSAGYSLFGRSMIRLMTDLSEVRELAYEYLPWLAISPLISVWSFWLDGVFIGATRAREMRNTMLLATFGCFLPAWFFSQGWGNHGLWFALMVFLGMRGISMGVLLGRPSNDAPGA